MAGLARRGRACTSWPGLYVVAGLGSATQVFAARNTEKTGMT
jgi:hypothetical protein